jgi:hypothetical protein
VTEPGAKLTILASEVETRRVAQREAEVAELREDYEVIRDACLNAFNPPDSDGAEPSIMAGAIKTAQAYIEEQPCLCTRELIEDNDPCGRCYVLGRVGDKTVTR